MRTRRKRCSAPDTKTAIAELDDRAGMEKALAGSKRVFIVTGHNPKSAAQQINVIDAAKAVRAEYIVKVSGGRAVTGPNVESVNGRAHHRDRGASQNLRPAMVHPEPGPVHAEHRGTGGEHQERRQDRAAVAEGPSGSADRRARHRRTRRARAAGPRQARRQGLFVHRRFPRPTATSPT